MGSMLWGGGAIGAKSRVTRIACVISASNMLNLKEKSLLDMLKAHWIRYVTKRGCVTPPTLSNEMRLRYQPQNDHSHHGRFFRWLWGQCGHRDISR